METKKIKNTLYRTLCGFFLGISVVAPGVSGSVMAVMMGIYRDLIAIISNPFKNFKRNFFYLFPLGVGALISFALFIKAFAFLFEHYPIQSRALFMGLIVGGLPAIWKQARGGAFKKHYLIAMLGAFIAAGAVGLLARGADAEMTNPSLLVLCAAGAVGGAASMIPGMSVSMILMLLGVYDYLLKRASGFTSDLWGTLGVMLPVGGFFLLGMVLFSKLSKYLFEKYPYLAYFMVFGFLCGTLTAVAPDRPPTGLGGWMGTILLFAVGGFVSGLFVMLGKKFGTNGAQEVSV